MRVLVTGASGFVGSHVVRKLLEKRHSVRILRRKNSPTKLLEGLPLESVLGDVTDLDSILTAIRGCEAVFHIAGHISYWKGERALQNRINIEGTQNIVRACLKERVTRLVHTSSIAAIGFGEEGQVVDEALSYNWGPYRINYNDSKFLAEEEVRSGIARGLDAVIVNPAVVFGAGDIHLHAGAMVCQIARGKMPFYFDGGCCTCDVEDVADGHVEALEKGRKGERYILGGENFRWKELFRLIAETVQGSPPKWKIPLPLMKTLALLEEGSSKLMKKRPRYTPEAVRVASLPCYYSSKKAIRELGYQVTPFKKTVQKTYDWYKANGYLT
ncbi:MAG: SDR family oxidoreductase [Deltaproteobacteria bacterium]|nr:SDR family oxidoreductase [Deltaproteobacteria bacterium]